MKTLIFKNYLEFHNREDKTLNGVSEEFAKEYPNFEEDNETNEACWNCSFCSSCSFCSFCSFEEKKENINNPKPTEEPAATNGNPPAHTFMVIPKIENIHQKVLEAVSKEGALDMSTWHENEEYNEEGAHCGTTHCRAGWVVALAGKAGRVLEQQTSTEFAAKHIYRESSSIHVSLTKFYVKNEESMQDIIRCADEEKKLNS